MSKYQDRNTMYHDKECTNGEPSSNNGWIYSAYSQYLAPNSLDMNKVCSTFSDCVVFRYPMIINRLPGKLTPLMSKDEVVGMVSLGLLSYKTLERSHFNFCNRDFGPRKLSLMIIIKAIYTLFKIRKEHRNYVWQNRLYSAYPLAFRLSPEDIYYVKAMSGVKTTLLENIVFNLNIYTTMKWGNRSSKMFLWLKLKDLNHSTADKLPLKAYVLDYFGKDHIFYTNMK